MVRTTCVLPDPIKPATPRISPRRNSKLADQAKEMLHVVALQTAGRLVHQNDSRPRGNRPTNLDYLSGSNRQVGNSRLWTNFGMMKRAQHFCRARAELLSIKQA